MIFINLSAIHSRMSASKEAVQGFRWFRALQKHKVGPAPRDPLSRYTNFTLQHAWEKFDCQTQLLHREAFVPLMAYNPSLLDPDVDRFNPVYFDIVPRG